MLARNGSAAYDEAHRTIEIAQRAEAEMNKVARNAPPIRAEIDEHSTAGWYFVQTFPGDERRALRHLARRRFAGFLAMKPKEDDEGFGAERTAPGWLLVYVFDMDKMRFRLLETPGIQGILRDPKTSLPLVVDQRFIDTAKSRHFQIKYRQPVKVPEGNPQKPHRPRRPNKLERKALDRLKDEMKKRPPIYNEMQWELINGLEPNIRIAVLDQTLRPLTVAASGTGA